jgi:HSP20 family protein
MAEKNLQNVKHAQLRPISTICECDGKIVIEAEMPGVSKDGLDIRIENDELRIVGERANEKPKGQFLLHERPEGSYYRSYTLDETIDRENVSAELNDGILTVTLGLSEALKPRKIEVKTK